MGGMPLNDMPWWRWRSNVRSALHMLSDPAFQQNVWLTGVEGYGDVTDAVYRLVEDTWLDNWSAEKYVGTIFRDSQEAAQTVAHAAPPYPGGAPGAPESWAVDRSWRPRRRRRRASSSVMLRSAAAWR